MIWLKCPIVGYELLGISVDTEEEAMKIVKTPGFVNNSDEDEGADYPMMQLSGVEYVNAIPASPTEIEAIQEVFGK